MDFLIQYTSLFLALTQSIPPHVKVHLRRARPNVGEAMARSCEGSTGALGLRGGLCKTSEVGPFCLAASFL